jgi:putative phage-type endonuclease
MNKLLNKKQIVQRSNEWYSIRNNIITSTDVSTILDLNKFQNKRDLILKKINNKTSSPNEAMEWGNFFEDIACSIYSKINNKKVYNLGLLIHDVYKFLGASPDGLIENNYLLEIKCPFSQKIYKNIPINYWIQTQIQMEVCNLNKTILFVCVFDKSIKPDVLYSGNKNGVDWSLLNYKEFVIERDRKWFSDNLFKIKDFYKDLNYYKVNGFSQKRKLHNTISNIFIKKLKTEYRDWNKWIELNNMFNYFNKDTFLDWMNMYGIKYYKKDNYSKPNKFIIEKSITFKNKIIEYIVNKYPNKYIIITDNTKYNTKSNDLFERTIDSLKKYPIVINGIIHNFNYKAYGGIDIIINKEYMKKLFGINSDKDSCFIKIEYKTINYLSDNITSENNSFINAYMYILENALLENNITSKSYIMGYKSKFSNNCFDKIALINTNEKNITNAIDWLSKLKNSGNNWNLTPPTVPELYPNMKNTTNYPWNSAKKLIAKELDEITLLHGISYKFRNQLHEKNIFKIKDIPPNLIDNKLLNINYYSNDLIKPSKIINNYNNWKSTNKILYIDFETVNDLNDSFENFPLHEKTNLIYMIGVGYKDSQNWKYYNLTVKSLNLENEKEILISFKNLLEELDYDIIIHWSNAELNFLKNANKRHNLNIELKNNVDLRKIFEKEPISIKGLYNYKLKEVIKVMNNYNFIDIKYDTIDNGLEAMILTWKYNEQSLQKKIPLYNINEFKEIIYYNEIDCKSMYEIILYLKQNHI